jgi:hypothetical protein
VFHQGIRCDGLSRSLVGAGAAMSRAGQHFCHRTPIRKVSVPHEVAATVQAPLDLPCHEVAFVACCTLNLTV